MTENPTLEPFFKNLRDEMEYFHERLPEDYEIEVFVAWGGHEYSIKQIVPVSPNMLVCECRDGHSIVQHVSTVQLKFAPHKIDQTGQEKQKPLIGFRISEDGEQIS